MRRWGRRFAAASLFIAACQAAAPPATPPVSPAPTGAAAAAAANAPSDESLWRMSRDPEVVSSGQRAFRSSSCGSCHGFTLAGGTGPNLLDRRWLHGGTPREVLKTVSQGVPSKGMPTWGPVLGPKMIADIVAYIFSHHQPGEPIEVQPFFVPGSP